MVGAFCLHESSPSRSVLSSTRVGFRCAGPCLSELYSVDGVVKPYSLASGCVVGCRICNREVVGSNLSLGYFAPRSTQPSIPPGSVNEYQLRLGRQRQVWLIPIADERLGVQVKL